MAVTLDTVTKVSLRGCPDYLPRVSRIVACLADYAGMDEQEVDDAKLVLTEACTNAIRHGSPRGYYDHVEITFTASNHTITADVTESFCDGMSSESEETDGIGIRLMRMLSDKVQLIKHKTGCTVRLMNGKETTDRSQVDIEQQFSV